MTTRNRLLQDVAIKRNALDQARGCLGEVTDLYTCQQYEELLMRARGLLTQVIERARPHQDWHTPRGH